MMLARGAVPTLKQMYGRREALLLLGCHCIRD